MRVQGNQSQTSSNGYYCNQTMKICADDKLNNHTKPQCWALHLTLV